MLWLPSLPQFRKSGGKIVNAALITKALAMSQPIFKLESSRLSSHDEFL
jgi:hypothetical protein